MYKIIIYTVVTFHAWVHPQSLNPLYHCRHSARDRQCECDRGIRQVYVVGYLVVWLGRLLDCHCWYCAPASSVEHSRRHSCRTKSINQSTSGALLPVLLYNGISQKTIRTYSEKLSSVDVWLKGSAGIRGVDPYGTGGTRPPPISGLGDIITNVPPQYF